MDLYFTISCNQNVQTVNGEMQIFRIIQHLLNEKYTHEITKSDILTGILANKMAANGEKSLINKRKASWA